MKNKLEEIVKTLTKKKKTISTMESCTGGGLANAITNIEGSSNILKFSAVTYSNEYKIKMGVSKNTIDKYTVYSEKTAEDMAKTISDFTNSNYGIGITGKLNRKDENNKAGKDNEVFISIYDKDNNIYNTFNMYVTKATREENKKQVINELINSLYEILK